jgi:hypothetical protein
LPSYLRSVRTYRQWHPHVGQRYAHYDQRIRTADKLWNGPAEIRKICLTHSHMRCDSFQSSQSLSKGFHSPARTWNVNLPSRTYAERMSFGSQTNWKASGAHAEDGHAWVAHERYESGYCSTTFQMGSSNLRPSDWSLALGLQGNRTVFSADVQISACARPWDAIVGQLYVRRGLERRAGHPSV